MDTQIYTSRLYTKQVIYKLGVAGRLFLNITIKCSDSKQKVRGKGSHVFTVLISIQNHMNAFYRTDVIELYFMKST